MKIWIAAAVVLGVVGAWLLWKGLDLMFTLPAASEPVSTQMGASPSPAAEATPTSSPAARKRESGTGSDAEGDRPRAPAGGGSSGEITARPWDDPVKGLLIQVLAREGWNDEDLKTLERFLSDPRAEFRPEVLTVNATHQESAEQYQQHLTAEAVSRTYAYWEGRRGMMESAAGGAGVPLEVIVAILKVETNLGVYPGKESVFNVYWSLALGDREEVLSRAVTGEYPNQRELKAKLAKRARWARGQLRDLMYMAREGHGRDPVGMMGSWAGAFGLAQFIPSSYRAYGRDGNGDGVIDLDDVADAAASIANYLHRNGWPADGSEKRRRKAIRAYNHSEHYVDCVLALADSLSRRRAQMLTLGR